MAETSRYVPNGPVLPKAQAFADFINRTELWSGLTRRPAAETRRMMTPPSPSALRDFPEGRIHDYAIPVNGGEILGRLYTPPYSPNMPLIVWCHGGGFAFGSVTGDDKFLRRLVVATGAAVLAVDYRLAPEHKFPVPVDDVVAAIRWGSDHRHMRLDQDGPIFVAGDSAGANLATVAAMLLRGSKTIITGQILAYPSTDADPQLLRGFVPPFCNAEEILWLWDQYIPDHAQRSDPRFSPMREHSLAGMPPTLILTAEHDLLTEQSEAYGKRLMEEGVVVRMRRFPGQVHGFVTAEPFANEEGAAALVDIGGFIQSR